MKIINHSAKLLQVTPDALLLIEQAGRLCYKSDSVGKPADFVTMLRNRGHLSVLEHASATILIGTDRGVTHELVRHRIASYSQVSTRYVNYCKKDIAFVPPVELELGQWDFATWAEAMHHCQEAYNRMIEFGCSPQIARSVLPNSLHTEIVVTMNFRSWLHFLELRTAAGAHPDMRYVADLVWGELRKACPEVFAVLS